MAHPLLNESFAVVVCLLLELVFVVLRAVGVYLLLFVCFWCLLLLVVLVFVCLLLFAVGVCCY